MSQNSYAAVLVKNAADEFVGEVPTVGQAPSGQRMVPAELLLLKLAERLGMIGSRLNEIEVAFQQIVGQHGEQEILQKAPGKCDLDIRSQQRRHFPGEESFLQAGVPKRALIDQLRFASAERRLGPCREDKHSRSSASQQRKRLLNG